jgi:RNA recognition motif-containing protein
MGTRLFVGNLSYSVTEQDLKAAFTGEGIDVRSVRVALDRESGRPRGFAFVETETDEGARLSREKLSGFMLQGRPLVVEEAQAKPAPGARPPGPGGGPPRGFAPRPPGPPGHGGPGFGRGPGGPGPGFGRGPGPGAGPGPGPGGPMRGYAPRSAGPGGPTDNRIDRPPRGAEGRRDRPEKKRSTRPRPEEKERGNWRWKGTIDED